MSSFLFPIYSFGSTGSTGPTGPIGPIGATGAAGSNVYGDTGSSIIGISFSDFRLVFEWEDGSTKQSGSIKGLTGPWIAQFGATGPANGVLVGVIRNPQLGVTNNVVTTSSDSLILRNLITTTPDTLGITLNEAGTLIEISYLGSIGFTLNDSEINRLIVGTGTTSFAGATNTKWNNQDNTLEWKIAKYQEGITLINGEQESTGLEYTLDTSTATVFQLTPNYDPEISSTTIVINGSDISSSESRGITIIVPRGNTGYTGQFNFNTTEPNNSNVWLPLIIPSPMSGVNVYSAISYGKNWYVSCSGLGISNDINSKQDIINLVFPTVKTTGPFFPCNLSTPESDNWLECQQLYLNGDKIVNSTDLSTFLSNWGDALSLYPLCDPLPGITFERPCLEG